MSARSVCTPMTGAMIVAGLASATVERSIVVAQPIVTEETLCISDVTYITYSEGYWGDVVGYTCEENYIAVDGHETPANRNAASLAGIKAEPDPYHFQEQALYGDTVRVVVDLSEMDTSKLDFGAKYIVDATLECILINATRSMRGYSHKAGGQIDAKYLRVDVEGAVDFAKLSRTYRFKDLLKRKLARACFGTD
jgi:hypothetical protein